MMKQPLPTFQAHHAVEPEQEAEIGAPITEETGTATAKAARNRARYSAGYQ